MAGLTGWHFLIIALIILLLFGATRLPALAKGVGQSMKVFKNEMKTDENGKKLPTDAEASTASTDAAHADSAESKPKS
ncbi:twin-arginine translocase TatA/TatE family subunit [Parafrigoribacterium soli]|uniref:twin-arginine translocase TatA/TatE family subunit n=1 Tax=Parafrigoribacterium soli TaxID=3144663 RepID=UPI0032EE5B60